MQKMLQDNSDIVFSQGSKENQDVIKLDKDKFVYHVPRHIINQVLQYSWH